MAITTIEQLKRWFSKGEYPTQAQFWAWLESYRHKGEKIAVSDVEGLADGLNGAYTRAEGDALYNAMRAMGGSLTRLEAGYDDIVMTAGKPGGFVELDGNGEVGTEHLPVGARGPVWLRGCVERAVLEGMAERHGRWFVTDEGVVEDTDADGETVLTDPAEGVVYVDEGARNVLRWTGTGMEPLNGPGMPVVDHEEAEATIGAGVLHRWGEMAALTVDLAPEAAGYAAEYCLEFTSGATATRLSLPASVKFPEDPEIEANMRYQVSIVDGMGLIAGVEV